MKELFRRISARISSWTGTAGAFILALSVVILWAVTGPLFHFSNTWQLVINTGTTIVTFLMVFLIQNTQNRDSKAMQLKLDELIRGTRGTRDKFIDIEDLTDQELLWLDEEFKLLHGNSKVHAQPAIHKLHKKIVAAHEHRQKSKTLSQHATHMAGQVVSTIISPFGTKDKD
jgi:low affinity Fe/Cu permease